MIYLAAALGACAASTGLSLLAGLIIRRHPPQDPR